jgi:hypothetical protein
MIDKDLSNVVNLEQFPNLTAAQREKLAQNGFVVAPGDREQLFYIYEENSYKKIPGFVTTDSVLHVYHVFYDCALRNAESEILLPRALTLTGNMLNELAAKYAAITDNDAGVKGAALRALAYFGVAQVAFGEALPADFPAEARALVESETALFEAAAGRSPSPIFGYDVDYSLFTPRGHYTRSEDLERYFKGMAWYGAVPFPLYRETDGVVTRYNLSALTSIVVTTALCSLPAEEGVDLWESLYSATASFVGAADDMTPFECVGIIDEIYGGAPDLNNDDNFLFDPMSAFYEKAEALPPPRISAESGPVQAEGKEAYADRQFRFMGQRYIPDSEILQKLSAPIERPFPTGLDVFASLGSKRAADLIAEQYRPAEAWPAYPETFERVKAQFTALPDSVWQSNMYCAWLWTQRALIGECSEGYPLFMQNTAWQDKSLATALGSHAEMRHDTILYAKPSGVATSAYDAPPPVRAYVEPNAELYNRLLWLTAHMRENLSARGILPAYLLYACEKFEDMLALLRDCSIRELAGEDLTGEEYYRLFSYGGLLEQLMSNAAGGGANWYAIESETDRNMALIADVHTADPDGYLEEAVGTAAEIYVVAPIEGKLYLTRGAMFDYFEFISPDKRLTDEQWQAMLREGAPARPPFTESFLADEAQEIPAPGEPYINGDYYPNKR